MVVHSHNRAHNPNMKADKGESPVPDHLGDPVRPCLKVAVISTTETQRYRQFARQFLPVHCVPSSVPGTGTGGKWIMTSVAIKPIVS